MQTASAFSSVQDSLSFFITAYRTLAEWQSVVARLDGFEASIQSANAVRANPGVTRIAAAGSDAIALDDLNLTLPNGQPLMSAADFKINRHERTLIAGPSGSGKSTLFRAIAGIWPFGSGNIAIPAGASIMMLPQRPYFPVGELHAAIVYPAETAAFSAAQVAEVVEQIGLPALADRLAEHGHWNRTLSLGEQQRLGVARALLHKPQYLFLDEATASLDEPSEAALYRLLARELPDTTIVSIGHRSTLDAFHDRDAVLTRSGDGFTLQDKTAAAAPAAS
jgi:putative ATP-binding cassette transporter